MKPIMNIDSTNKETHWVPIHPETGEVWKEKMDDLDYAGTLAKYESDDELRAKYEAEYQRLAEGVEMREQPAFFQSILLLGEAAAKHAEEIPMQISCHPKTWALLTDEQKALFEPFDVDQWRADGCPLTKV